MIKKMLILKFEAEAKKDPARAEQVFRQMLGRFEGMAGEEKEKLLAQFEDFYKSAKALKCDNVVKYMEKFKQEKGV